MTDFQNKIQKARTNLQSCIRLQKQTISEMETELSVARGYLRGLEEGMMIYDGTEKVETKEPTHEEE